MAVLPRPDAVKAVSDDRPRPAATGAAFGVLAACLLIAPGVRSAARRAWMGGSADDDRVLLPGAAAFRRTGIAEAQVRM
jgi:hypothetical protein